MDYCPEVMMLMMQYDRVQPPMVRSFTNRDMQNSRKLELGNGGPEQKYS